jgi:beta-mannosidase
MPDPGTAAPGPPPDPPAGRRLDDWRVALADEGLRRHYPDPSFDDDGWERVDGPAHWRSVPAFADTEGPLLYRQRLSVPFDPDRHDGRSWIVLDGVFYTSDVWFDGAYLGDTEGYFFPHAFEVTDAMQRGGEHVLALEVACPPQRDRTRKRNLTGVFQHWDMLDQEWNPGGIWRPVHLVRTGAVRVTHHRVLCRDADEQRATLFVRAVLDTVDPRSVELRTVVADPDGREVVEVVRDQQLAGGENRLEWTVAVPEPRLWWPHALGDQPRYDVTVEVLVEGRVSDRFCSRTGLRRLQLQDWVLRVNGERLFLKGANQGPTRMALAEATAEDLATDVRLAVEANLDLLRVHAHVSRPELYEAADAAGLLVWQDMPLQWGYGRGVRDQARRQARELVDLLAHHPSVAMWCGHNEPMAVDLEPGVLGDPRRLRRLAVRGLAAQLLPTWNKTFLDHAVATVLERTDGSRPVIPHSGVLPHPPQLDGTDSHLYFGWYWGEERDLAPALAAWPRLARFVSEFGAQAVPDDAAFLEPERWPDLDWDRAERRHSLQKERFDRYVPPADHPTFTSWAAATQRYQAQVVRHHVEALRRIKYRPCGGFAVFAFGDGYPSVSWAVLDHRRRPKPAYAALAAACRPVIVVADRLPADLAPGDAVQLDVHVISDRRITMPDMLIVAHLSWREGGDRRRRTWRWEGDVPADACSRIGTVDAVVPRGASGAVELELELRHAIDGDVPPVVTNHFATELPPTNHPH